ncbi:MAG: hypothetical protein MJ252_05405, partial [archaeon]|nr:hypothetical protein [archaeon]
RGLSQNAIRLNACDKRMDEVNFEIKDFILKCNERNITSNYTEALQSIMLDASDYRSLIKKAEDRQKILEINDYTNKYFTSK